MTKRSPAVERPLQVVVGLDGEPFHGDDGCPICLMMRQNGDTIYTLTREGELEPLPEHTPAAIISVTVVPNFTSNAYLGHEPLVEAIPMHCNAYDFVEYLKFKYAELRTAGRLQLRRGGMAVRGTARLRDGDRVSVYVRSR